MVGAGVVVAWDFSRHALTTEGVALGARVTAGRQLGTLLAAMLVLLTLAGLAVGFLTGRQAPSSKVRRNAGVALLTLLAVAVIAFAGALAASHRGLPGSISHGFHSLTDTNARVPNTPGRLTAVASVRARYWNEALKVFQAHPVLGAGAEGYRMARLRYRTAPIEVRHAHGFVVQTLADLGLVGLTLALALLVAWMVAAGRSTHPFNRRWTSGRTATEAGGDWRSDWRPAWRRWTISGRPAPYTPERIGTLCMLCLVVVFGVHSLVDWTWYVPGNACVALLCAGWLAGRGPLEPSAAEERSEVFERAMAERSRPLPAGAPDPYEPVGEPGGAGRSGWRPSLREVEPAAGRHRLRRAGRGTVGRVGAVAAAELGNALPGSSRAARTPVNAASAKAQAAVARDPVSVQALFALAAIQQATGNPDLARATLQHAVRLQPSNPETWLRLGQYDLASVRAQTAGEGVPQAAVNELRCSDLPEPRVDRPRSDRRWQSRSDQHPERLRRSAARVHPLEARPARRASSSRRAPGSPARAPHVDVLEPEVLEQPGEGAMSVEAQVIGARIEVGVERARGTARAPAARAVRARGCSAAGCRPSAARGAPPTASPRCRRRARSSRPPTRRRSSRPPAARCPRPARPAGRARDGGRARGEAAPPPRPRPRRAKPARIELGREAPFAAADVQYARRGRLRPARRGRAGVCLSRNARRRSRSGGSNPSGSASHRLS